MSRVQVPSPALKLATEAQGLGCCAFAGNGSPPEPPMEARLDHPIRSAFMIFNLSWFTRWSPTENFRQSLSRTASRAGKPSGHGEARPPRNWSVRSGCCERNLPGPRRESLTMLRRQSRTFSARLASDGETCSWRALAKPAQRPIVRGHLPCSEPSRIQPLRIRPSHISKVESRTPVPSPAPRPPSAPVSGRPNGRSLPCGPSSPLSAAIRGPRTGTARTRSPARR